MFQSYCSMNYFPIAFSPQEYTQMIQVHTRVVGKLCEAGAAFLTPLFGHHNSITLYSVNLHEIDRHWQPSLNNGINE
jgi:hypothetical protein